MAPGGTMPPIIRAGFMPMPCRCGSGMAPIRAGPIIVGNCGKPMPMAGSPAGGNPAGGIMFGGGPAGGTITGGTFICGPCGRCRSCCCCCCCNSNCCCCCCCCCACCACCACKGCCNCCNCCGCCDDCCCNRGCGCGCCWRPASGSCLAVPTTPEAPAVLLVLLNRWEIGTGLGAALAVLPAGTPGAGRGGGCCAAASSTGVGTTPTLPSASATGALALSAA